MTSHIYETNLATVELPRFAPPPATPRSPAKDVTRWRSPAKANRIAKSSIPDYDEYHKLLRSDITTTGEKDLASRVVKAAEKLKDWCNEIEQWGWTGSFERPSSDAQESDNEDLSGVQEYCGSLPQALVDTYETRLDEVDEELATLEVDELKEHVLGIHLGRSRPSSSYSVQSLSTLNLMDDFQLFVTETLMYTLPFHAKLKQYLRAWSMRLAVLVEVTSFLVGLQLLRSEMDRAYTTLQEPVGPALPAVDMEALEERLEIQRKSLKDIVTTLGRQLDKMLDTLEGSDEQLPEDWIDRFENDEKEYSEWSFHAEKQMFNLRMQHQSVTTNTGSGASITSGNPSLSETPAPIATGEVLETTEDAVPLISESIATRGVVNLGQDHPQDNKSDQGLVQAIDAEEIPATGGHHGAGQPDSKSLLDDEKKSLVVPDSGDTQGFEPAETMIHHAPVEAHRDTFSNGERDSDTELGLVDSRDQESVANDFDHSNYASSDDESDREETSEDSPSARAGARYIARQPKPPLNHAMQKRRGGNMLVLDSSRTFSTPFPDLENISTDFSPPRSPTKTSKSSDSPIKGSRSPISPSVPLQEQISNILESIPAPIRLTTGPSPNAPEIKKVHKRTSSSQQPRSRAATPSLSPQPQITLAPADEVATRKAGAHDPEIRLYHLSQAGQARPIKLFVRRVGENGERVMVRIGGGWADLGEYLRDYAAHHGRRTVSDGRVEVLGLTNDSPATSGTPDSRRASLISSIGSSALAGTARESTRSPTPSFANHTPSHIDDNLNSLPSSPTASSAGGRRISSMPWDGADVSLSGHRAVKKGEMSEEKNKWVDDIVEQAKASIPGRKVEFGDLGKRGGTRRVFLKGGKPTEQ